MKMTKTERLTYNLLIKESKKKSFLRQSNSENEDRTFVPFARKGTYYSSAFSPVVARCLGLYSSMLNACPLECDKENPVHTLFTRRPYPPISKSNFFEIMIQNYFLFEGFFAVLRFNNKMEVKAVCPYQSPNSFNVYPVGYSKKRKGHADQVGGEWVDPINIYEKGYFALDYKGRHFNQDEFIYIKNNMYNTRSLLEQENIFQRIFNQSFSSAALLEAVIESICQSDLKAPIVLTGLGFSGEGRASGKATASETKKVKQALREYFSGQSQDASKSCLALPPGYQIQKLNLDNPAGLIQALNGIVSANVCNIFGIPSDLIFIDGTERTQKEARRLFISGAFASFCTLIEDELNRLTDYQYKFKFNIDSLRIKQADLREESALAQLLGIYTKEEIKKKIESS